MGNIIRIAQIITYFLLCIPLRFFFKMDRGAVILNSSQKYILVSNHPSKLDPFLVAASLPFRSFLFFLPLRFITAQSYLENPIHRIFLMTLGCISNHPKNGKILDLAEILLRNGQSLYIFPKGGLENRDNQSPKVGAVYLERKIPEVFLLPIKIYISHPLSIIEIIQRKIKVEVTWKSPFRHREFPKDLQLLSDDLMERIMKDG